MEKILVTGSAGFIGMHLCQKLLKEGYQVFGLDNMNDYYDIIIKESRIKLLKDYENFNFVNCDILDNSGLTRIFKKFNPDKVVNLAAQAGVRYSLINPQVYMKVNVLGFLNILEHCKKFNVKGLIYASSSSVYGGNQKIPFSVDDVVDKPISIYAASKISNELMAYTYGHLFSINTTGLRFFTVYGPWGRPDMAIHLFTKNISNNKPIDVYNYGKMKRDFTYVKDIVSGTLSAIKKNYQCEVFNLGNNKVEELKKVIQLIEIKLNKKARLNLKDIQPGDVKETFADINYSKKMLGYSPSISLEEGISLFIEWYQGQDLY
ncbi:MAG: protein CapI [Candidatus Marinimicrobia bacterium]|nr:protein CapI [Candidatus Neomarinimicrobiota bacterium]|tara:strand:- start:2661 stop:3617 length:957 start_codon:yes stop_codon:yes gene_type:complete